MLAPVYMRLGRFDDAVAARRKSLALNGATATRESDLGEALATAANGVVTAEAKGLFERAVARDPHEAKARYFLGLAAEQDGKADAAAAIWRALLADAPPERSGSNSCAARSGALPVRRMRRLGRPPPMRQARRR